MGRSFRQSKEKIQNRFATIHPKTRCVPSPFSLLPSPFCVPFPFFAFFSQNFGLPFVCVYTMRAVGLLRSRNYNSPWYE